jgi:O-antigen ligase
VSGAIGRRWVLPLLGLTLAVLLAIGVLVVWLRLPVAGSDAIREVPLAADKSLGINADLSHLDGGEREAALEAMEAAGFRWLRQRFPWDVIEPQRGVYDWTIWDGIVDGAHRHHLKLTALLDGAPLWARAAEDAANPLAPPVEARDFGAFVAAFVARYGNRIDHYQLWDEPNIAPHWGASEIDPTAYAWLLREGAVQIRAVDPAAVILMAALAPNTEAGGANMSELLFLDALYQQGAAQWFDVVAAQPYGFDDPLDAPSDPDRLNWQRVALLRRVMDARGDAGTAVWAVSFGLTEMQPQDTSVAVEQARNEWPWLGPMLWAAWSPDDAHGRYALTDADGRGGPVLNALRVLAMAAPMAWPGAYSADHPSGVYEGNWRVTSQGADIGSSGDRLVVSFRGTGLDLKVRRGEYRAFLFATVDGQPANALPRDAQGRSYVVLYDPLRAVDTVTLARGLPDGDHVAEIVAERGWGQWAIVGWAVSRVLPGGPGWLPVALGLGALVSLGVAVYTSWPFRGLLFETGSVLLSRYRALPDRWVLTITLGAAALVYVTVGTVPSLVAVSLLAVVLLLRPEAGLPLIAVALPAYQLGKPLLGKVFSMVEILTLLTAAGWAVNTILGIRGQRARSVFHVSRLTSLDWGVMVFVVMAATSLLWSEHLREAAREFRTVVLEAGIFYGLLRAMVLHRRDAWRVVGAWILGAALIALMALCQWAFGRNLITAEGVWRVRGFYGSPNNLALYLGRVFPVAVVMAIWGQARQQGQGRQRQLARWACALTGLVMVAALFLTYSRGAWLLGVPVALLFLAALRGRRALAAAVGILILAAVVLVLIVGPARLTLLLDTTEGTTFFRLQLWQSSWAMIRDHPVVGVGLDNFLYHYRTHYVLPTAWEEFDLSHPHNLVLDFWLRLGLPGLAVLGWLLAAFFQRGWQAYQRLPESDERLLALGVMAGMVNFLAHGLVDNAFFLVDLGFVFMLMLALVQVGHDQHPLADTLGRA